RTEVAVERLDVAAYEIPTDEPESDGTLEWNSTTIVVVEAHAGNETGLGYTYGPAAAGKLVEELLAGEVEGADALAPDKTWERLLRVKMKISREPERDAERLDAARAAIGDDVELYVDSNGALGRNEALAWAHRLRSEWNVTWFEEPVPSADLDGLRLLCRRAPAGLDIAAGEYGYVLADFQNLLGSVSCLQADVTRCGGITGLLQAAGLAGGHGIDVSAHCAPQLSAHAFCAVPTLRHLEYFHDHIRVERLLFDGVLEPVDGELRPDRSRAGHGLTLRHADARDFAV